MFGIISRLPYRVSIHLQNLSKSKLAFLIESWVVAVEHKRWHAITKDSQHL